MDLIQYGTSFRLDMGKSKISGENEFVVRLTVDEIDTLMEDLGMEEDHAGTPKTKKAFNGLYRKLERILEIGDDS
ncbi:MAG: hypothetical protein V1913_10655 [Fibrobacterota bacterium]